MKIDTHVHTLHSNPTAEILIREGYRVKKVVDTAASKDLDAIILTDFNHVWGFDALYDNIKLRDGWLFDEGYERKREESAVIVHSSNYKKPLTVFLGEEIRTKQGEIIGAFIKDHIKPNRGIDETIEKINGEGGIVIFPHPIATFSGGIGEDELRRQLINLRTVNPKPLEAVEVFNGQLAFPFNCFDKKAKEIAKEFDAFKVGGSDAAYLFSQYNRVGEVYTNFTNLDELSKEAIRDYIKYNRKTEIIGSYDSIFSVALTMFYKQFKKLKKQF